MKRCLQCGSTYDSVEWMCPACGASPAYVNGFVAFAPDLAAYNDGMEPDAHHGLDVTQDSSFWFRVRNRLITDLVRRYFPTAERVLEIGCGTGYVLQALRTALPQSCLSGSEIYANGLPYAARRLGPEVKLFQMDARDIPYATEFDLICAFDVLEHVAEDERVLHELYRALRPGGGVLLSVPQHQFLWSKSDEISLHKRRYRRGELESKCRKAKLHIIRSTSFVTTLLPLMLLQRRIWGRRKAYDADAELTLPLLLDQSLEFILELERKILRAGVSFPLGGSRFVAARRQPRPVGRRRPSIEEHVQDGHVMLESSP
ncbi:MAG: SAM-dependent methyltransferase protein [Microvirga sp.]|nr:SAM-dependent methyltransferase protein [Microvirga sp.]